MSDTTRDLGSDGNERRTDGGEVVTPDEERRTEESQQPDLVEVPDEDLPQQDPDRGTQSPDYSLPDTAPVDPIGDGLGPTRIDGDQSPGV
jgi:hypothetical protein